MKTEIAWDHRLPRENILLTQYDAVFPDTAYLNHQLLVIDGLDWGEALPWIQQHGLMGRKRAFKDPFIDHKPEQRVQAAVDNILAKAKAFYSARYPWPSQRNATSFRPLITGPEPLHYDSYGGAEPLVTAYINVSPEPRVYRIGYNFPQLLEAHPKEVMAAYAERRAARDDASYPLRQRTKRGLPPMGPDAPRHTVHLAPGAIWFFNAKTVSHEVVHGTGAIGISWEVPTSGAKLQHHYLKGLK